MNLVHTGRGPDWWYLLVAIPFPLFGYVVANYVGRPMNRLSHPISACRPPGGWDHFEVSSATRMGPPFRQ
jgi:hypothetical protein